MSRITASVAGDIIRLSPDLVRKPDAEPEA
jgi:hypothetical protein